MSEARGIASQWRKRGAVQASITRLRTRVTGLQSSPEHSDSLPHTHRIAQKLEDLDAELKTQHFALFELIEQVLTKEQELLNEHDDDIAVPKVSVERLLSTCTAAKGMLPPANPTEMRIIRH